MFTFASKCDIPYNISYSILFFYFFSLCICKMKKVPGRVLSASVLYRVYSSSDIYRKQFTFAFKRCWANMIYWSLWLQYLWAHHTVYSKRNTHLITNFFAAPMGKGAEKFPQGGRKIPPGGPQKVGIKCAFLLK